MKTQFLLKVFIANISLLFAVEGYANNLWSLVKKQQGPSYWECLATVEISFAENHTIIVTKQAEYGGDTSYYLVNQGGWCRRSNSSEILPRQNCSVNELVEDDQFWILSRRSCQGNLLGFKCNPKKEEVEKQVTIDKVKNTLTTYDVINHDGDPVIECVYSGI